MLAKECGGQRVVRIACTFLFFPVFKFTNHFFRFTLMQHCWMQSPSMRPNFSHIRRFLGQEMNLVGIIDLILVNPREMPISVTRRFFLLRSCQWTGGILSHGFHGGKLLIHCHLAHCRLSLLHGLHNRIKSFHLFKNIAFHVDNQSVSNWLFLKEMKRIWINKSNDVPQYFNCLYFHLLHPLVFRDLSCYKLNTAVEMMKSRNSETVSFRLTSVKFPLPISIASVHRSDRDIPVEVILLLTLPS